MAGTSSMEEPKRLCDRIEENSDNDETAIGFPYSDNIRKSINLMVKSGPDIVYVVGGSDRF